jgi:hypothetical protein
MIEKIKQTKFLIEKLSEVQEFYYSALLDEIEIKDESEEFLFDYIFNNSDDESFEEYLIRYDKKIEDVFNG